MNCKKCGKNIDEKPSQNGMCIDCFAEEWSELVEKSPIGCLHGV